jgi:AraC family transcriptional regulator
LSGADITQGSFDGDRRAGPIRVVVTRHAAGSVLARHTHDGPCFSLVLGGTFEETSADDTFSCAPGSLLFKPAFQPHANRYGPQGALSVLIEIGGEADIATRLPQRAGPIASRTAGERARWIAGAAVRDEAPEGEILDAASELTATAFAEESGGRTRDARPSPWLRRVYERLAACPYAAPGIGALAREEGVHPDHLIRAFRDAYGSTPGVFARRARARLAARRAALGERPLSVIAFKCGYADQSHMTREIRRFLGTTPGRIRTSHRGQHA